MVKTFSNGVQFLKRGFGSKADAFRYEAMINDRGVSDLRCGVLFSSYLDWYKKSYKFTSFDRVSKLVHNHFGCFMESDCRVSSLGYSFFQKWWDGICKDDSLHDKNFYLSFLRKVFDFSKTYFEVSNKYVYRLPLYHDYSEHKVVVKRIVSSDDFFRMLSFANRYFSVLFMLAFLLGLRIGEVRGLLAGDFEADKGRLLIKGQCQYNNGKNVLTSTKSRNSTRYYVLPRFFCAVLRDWISDNSLADDDFVFFGRSHDQPVSQVSVNRHLHSYQRMAGISFFPFHSFRKTSATFLNEQGIGGKWIADYLGHSSEAVTKEYYIGDTESKKREIAGILDARFASGFEKNCIKNVSGK
jgi:integrase